MDIVHRATCIAIVTNCLVRRRQLRQWLSDPCLVLAWYSSLEHACDSQAPALVVLERGILRNACREFLHLRRRWPSADIAVIGALGDDDIAALLDAGADDAMPGSTRACASRLYALARRSRTHQATSALAVGDVVLDCERRRASCGGQPLSLTPTEWSILKCLMARHPRIVDVQTINATAWEDPVDDQRRRLIRVYVSGLRAKLERSRHLQIVTRRREGYALQLRARRAPAVPAE
jgi:DNA-binding response OmpR family regulator